MLGNLNRLGHQGGSSPSGRQHAMPLDFQPFLQRFDVRRTADTVGPLDRDQLAFKVGQAEVR
ncbi:MAG: hypothetical protein E6K67_09730 [Nitrospirae bacterium]|nr:MAG: hypothetical protein E6K67_09730 [Nitrospirota bacterium]